MPLSIFFPDTAQPNTLASIELDATLSESHTRQSSVTDNPIEGGSQIQDHITNAPRTLQLEGFVTDDPIVLLGLGADNNKVQTTFDALEQLFDDRQPFTVVTGFRVYENVFFESLTMPRRREGALRFSALLKQLTIVSAQDAALPEDQVAADDDGTQDVAPASNDAGRQQSAPAGAEQEEESTLLLSTFESAGIL